MLRRAPPGGFGGVDEYDTATGSFIKNYNNSGGWQWAGLYAPNGDILVTAMRLDQVFRFNSVYTLLGSFAGTGWGNPHGIDIHPSTGLIYVVDGVSTQVHIFDPVTFVELDAAHLSPDPGDKIVDLEFRRFDVPVPVQSSTWSRIKTLAQ